MSAISHIDAMLSMLERPCNGWSVTPAALRSLRAEIEVDIRRSYEQGIEAGRQPQAALHAGVDDEGGVD